MDLTTLRLRREGLERVLLASADGILIDATDGTVLRRELSGMADAGLRIGADGDALYLVSAAGDQWIGGWISGFKASCQVWLDEHGRVGQRFRWRAKGPSRYDGPPPLLSRGRMLFPRCNSGHHQEGPAPYSKLHVVDAVSGTLLGDVNPLLDQGTAPIDLALVADRLYVADAGGAQPFNSNKLARIAVLTNDDHPPGDRREPGAGRPPEADLRRTGADRGRRGAGALPGRGAARQAGAGSMNRWRRPSWRA